MKKLLSLLLCCLLLCGLAGCHTPNSLQLDLYQGFGEEIKLIHLNARTATDRRRIDAFAQALADCEPLDKDPALFAYYPDYKLSITGKQLTAAETGDTGLFRVQDRPGERDAAITAVVDLNEDWVDFYFPEADGGRLYRSRLSSREFKDLVHYTGRKSEE